MLTWISTNKSNVGISNLNQWCIVTIEMLSSDSSDEASWLPHFIIDFFISISLFSHSSKLSKWINVFYKWHLTLWHYLEIRPGRYEIRPVISLRPLALRDHPFKTSACSRGGGVKIFPNLPTDSGKNWWQEGGRGQKSWKFAVVLNEWSLFSVHYSLDPNSGVVEIGVSSPMER